MQLCNNVQKTRREGFFVFPFQFLFCPYAFHWLVLAAALMIAAVANNGTAVFQLTATVALSLQAIDSVLVPTSKFSTPNLLTWQIVQLLQDSLQMHVGT